MSVLIQYDTASLNLVNIYAPKSVSDRKAFFENLHNHFLSRSDLIIGEDFNCVDNSLDKFRSNDVHTTDKKSLCSLRSDFSLFDIWRKHHPCVVSFTWSNSGKTQASRLDRFLVSRLLSDNFASCNIFPCIFSDHDFVDLEFDLNGSPRRRNDVWKFNCLLLCDPDFKQLITNVIEKRKLEVNNFSSLGDWWDDLKICFRKLSIDFSVRKYKKSNAERSSLTKQVI